MKKFLAILATGTLLIFGLLIAQPAAAHSDTPGPVWWELNGKSTPDKPFIEPQTYVGSGYVRDVICGTWYQVDQYKPGHPFGTKIKTLTGSSVDGQWLDYSHPFASTGKPWKFVYGGDCLDYSKSDFETTTAKECTVPLDGTAVITTTTTTTTTNYIWHKDENIWYGQPPVITTDTSTETVSDDSCVPTDNPTPTPEKPDAPTPTPVVATPQFTG